MTLTGPKNKFFVVSMCHAGVKSGRLWKGEVGVGPKCSYTWKARIWETKSKSRSQSEAGRVNEDHWQVSTGPPIEDRWQVSTGPPTEDQWQVSTGTPTEGHWLLLTGPPTEGHWLVSATPLAEQTRQALAGQLTMELGLQSQTSGSQDTAKNVAFLMGHFVGRVPQKGDISVEAGAVAWVWAVAWKKRWLAAICHALLVGLVTKSWYQRIISRPLTTGSILYGPVILSRWG